MTWFAWAAFGSVLTLVVQNARLLAFSSISPNLVVAYVSAIAVSSGSWIVALGVSVFGIVLSWALFPFSLLGLTVSLSATLAVFSLKKFFTGTEPIDGAIVAGTGAVVSMAIRVVVGGSAFSPLAVLGDGLTTGALGAIMTYVAARSFRS